MLIFFQQVLINGFTIPEWDPEAITDVLARLNPRNCQVRGTSKKNYKGNVLEGLSL